MRWWSLPVPRASSAGPPLIGACGHSSGSSGSLVPTPASPARRHPYDGIRYRRSCQGTPVNASPDQLTEYLIEQMATRARAETGTRTEAGTRAASAGSAPAACTAPSSPSSAASWSADHARLQQPTAGHHHRRRRHRLGAAHRRRSPGDRRGGRVRRRAPAARAVHSRRRARARRGAGPHAPRRAARSWPPSISPPSGPPCPRPRPPGPSPHRVRRSRHPPPSTSTSTCMASPPENSPRSSAPRATRIGHWL